MILNDEIDSLRIKIFDWLVEEGFKPNPKEDLAYANDFLLDVFVQVVNITIAKPKMYKRIVIGTGIILSEEDQKLYKSLNQHVRREFKFEVLRDLLTMKLAFGSIPQDFEHEFKSIQIMDTIYYDGLSKDRLFNVINKVIRGYAILMLSFEKYMLGFNPVSDNKLI
jgi:hypothetical protein